MESKSFTFILKLGGSSKEGKTLTNVLSLTFYTVVS